MTGTLKTQIVIVGGGAGGLELATRLGDTLGRRRRAEITLVDRARTHLWKPLLHSVAAGSLRRSQHELNYLAQAQWRNFTYVFGDVTGVDRVDLTDKFIDYASNELDPLGQQLWQIGFDGARKQLTTSVGFHEGSFAPSGAAFTDEHSSLAVPPTLSLCQSAEKCNVFWQTHAIDAYNLHPPERVEVKARDGDILYATLLLPAIIGVLRMVWPGAVGRVAAPATPL